MQGTYDYGNKSFHWKAQGKRLVCADLCHPRGNPIRFRHVLSLISHVENMRGKPLTHTHVPRRSAQKSRRNRSR